MACVWSGDCGSSLECQNHFCVHPSKTGNVQPINRYWDDAEGYNTFHAAPAWANEHEAGSNVFYAMSVQLYGTVPINRYWHGGALGAGKDNTFHPSPAWDQEHNAG